MNPIIILSILVLFFFLWNSDRENLDYAKQKFKYKEAKKNWDFTHDNMYDKLSKHPYITFDLNHKANPDNVYFPKTLKECQDIIKSSKKIRVSGGHHTFNDISISDDTIIRTYNLKKILKLDKKKKQVTVEAGILIDELNIYLEKNKLSLYVQTAIAYQCLGGVIAVSAHGSRLDKGSFSSMIVDITMILGNGKVKTYNKKDSEFLALKTNLGCLGMIYSVTLQCVDLFNVEHTRVKMSLENFLEQVDDLRKKNEFLQCYYFPFKDDKNCTVYLRKIKKSGEVSHKALTKNLEASYYTEIELGVDFKDWRKALKDIDKQVKEYREKHNYRSIYSILIRFTGKDDALLSLSNNRNTVFFNQFNVGSLSDDPLLNRYFKDFQDMMINKYKGRPHYGKKIYLDQSQMKKIYGNNVNKFNQVRNKLDPGRKFSNDYINRILGN